MPQLAFRQQLQCGQGSCSCSAFGMHAQTRTSSHPMLASADEGACFITTHHCAAGQALAQMAQQACSGVVVGSRVRHVKAAQMFQSRNRLQCRRSGVGPELLQYDGLQTCGCWSVKHVVLSSQRSVQDTCALLTVCCCWAQK